MNLKNLHYWDRGHSWIPYNVLVRYWKETTKINISTTRKFRKEYIKLTSTEMDDLCQWIKDKRACTNLQKKRKNRTRVYVFVNVQVVAILVVGAEKRANIVWDFAIKGKECDNSDSKYQKTQLL